LLPGMYVRVRISQAEVPNAVLLPQQAVTRTDTGDTVLVVGPGNKPEQRRIQIGQARGHDWIVLGGLEAGEQVIVDGFQKMMVPGAPVTPVPWRRDAAVATGAPGDAGGAAGTGAEAGAAAADASTSEPEKAH